MKQLFRLLFLVGFSLSLWAANSAASADVLNRWVGGKWTGSGQFIDTAYSQANKASGVTRCAWSPDHIFVICDQDNVFAGTRSRDLSIYSFAPKDSKYYFYGISLGVEKARNIGLDITDNGERWVYLSTNEVNGKPVQFRTTNQFHGSDAVDWWTEFSSDDGKTWTKTGEGKETREK
jgi:hypothetical protein